MKNYLDDIQELWNQTGLKPAQGLFIVAGIVAMSLRSKFGATK